MKKAKENNRLKKLHIYSIITVIVLLLPLLLMGRYDHMSADDYSFGLFAHNAWIDTHNPFLVIKAAAEYTYWVYRYWQGTYSSVFLMCLQPGIFHEKLYCLTPYITIGFLFLGIIVFLYSFCTVFFEGEKISTKIISLFVFIVCVEFVETPVEAFYWFNGSIHYTAMQGVLLCLLGLSIYYMNQDIVKKRTVLGLMLLALIVGGANYMTSLSAVLIEVAIALFQFIKNKKNIYLIVCVWVVSISGLLINIMAPGNHNRQSIYKGYSVCQTIYKSFEEGFNCITQLFTLSFVLMIFIFVPIAYYCIVKSEFSFHYPVLFMLVTLCLYCAQFAPGLYATRSGGPYRLRNATQYMFYIYFFLNEIYIIGYLKNNCNLKMDILKSKISYAILIVVFIFVSSYAGYNSYTSLSALHSIITNEAQLYHYHMCQREAVLKNHETDNTDVVLKAVPVTPKLITYEDAGLDTTDPFNTAIANYYHKKSVIVEPFDN